MKIRNLIGALGISALALLMPSKANAQAIAVPEPITYPGRPFNQHVWHQDFTTLRGTHVHRDLVLGPLGFVRQRHVDADSPPYAPPQHYHKDTQQSPLGNFKRKTVTISPGYGLPPSGPNEFYRSH